MAFLLFNKERGMKGGRGEETKGTNRVKAYLSHGSDPQSEYVYDRLSSCVVRRVIVQTSMRTRGP